MNCKRLPIGVTSVARRFWRAIKPASPLRFPNRSPLALRPRVASASRTLFISATRMCIAVLLEKSSLTTTPNEEKGLVLRRYWTNACQSCAIKQRCTTGKERRITRWEHEHVLEAVQKRLDKN